MIIKTCKRRYLQKKILSSAFDEIIFLKKKVDKYSKHFDEFFNRYIILVSEKNPKKLKILCQKSYLKALKTDLYLIESEINSQINSYLKALKLSPFSVESHKNDESIMAEIWIKTKELSKTINFLLDNINEPPKTLNQAYQYPPQVTEWLLNTGANINATNDDEANALHLACQYEKVRIAKLLIDNNVNTRMKDNQGNTPLHKAAQTGNFNMLKLLCETNAANDITTTNNEGKMPIHLLVTSKNLRLKTVQLLCKDIATGINSLRVHINTLDSNDDTLLTLACKYASNDTPNHLSVIQWLINVGADITHANDNGNTPMHFACLNGNLSLVNKLAKANPNTTMVQLMSAQNSDHHMPPTLVTMSFREHYHMNKKNGYHLTTPEYTNLMVWLIAVHGVFNNDDIARSFFEVGNFIPFGDSIHDYIACLAVWAKDGGQKSKIKYWEIPSAAEIISNELKNTKLSDDEVKNIEAFSNPSDWLQNFSEKYKTITPNGESRMQNYQLLT